MSAAELIAAAVGGAGGATLRMAVLEVAARAGRSNTRALSVVNIAGSAAAGAIAALGLGPVMAALLISGVLGSFTTLSSWIAEFVADAEEDGVRRPTAWLVAELAAGLAAALLAYRLVA